MKTTSPKLALSKAIAKYPTLQAFAAELGVPYQNVQQWMRNDNVPAEYCPRIEKMTGRETVCEKLNNKVDWGYVRSSPLPVKPPRTTKRKLQAGPP